MLHTHVWQRADQRSGADLEEQVAQVRTLVRELERGCAEQLGGLKTDIQHVHVATHDLREALVSTKARQWGERQP